MSVRSTVRLLAARAAVVLALASVAACGAVAQGGPAPAERLGAFLGADALAALRGAERIEPYLLRAALAPEAKAGPDLIAGYRWKARGADLPADAVAEFKAIALNPASYDFDVTKKCVMVPEYALRVHAGNRVLDVLISFKCAMWAFDVAGEQRVEDFDAVAGRLKAVVETVFRMD